MWRNGSFEVRVRPKEQKKEGIWYEIRDLNRRYVYVREKSRRSVIRVAETLRKFKEDHRQILLNKDQKVFSPRDAFEDFKDAYIEFERNLRSEIIDRHYMKIRLSDT